MTDSWTEGFSLFLDAAAPYLEELVVVGGAAARLHRLSPQAAEPEFAALGTLDVDAATRTGATIQAEPLDKRLASRGFEEVLSTDYKPPVTHYVLRRLEGFEVEFLADQPGGFDRRGKADMTAAVFGVTVQKLHYVGLLLRDPWTVTVSREDGFPIDVERREVRVPNPAAFIVQKLLARKYRGDKRGKDVLYIYDTVQLFGDPEELLGELWSGLSAKIPKKWSGRIATAAADISAPTYADVVTASTIALAAGRSLNANTIAATLKAGLAPFRNTPA